MVDRVLRRSICGRARARARSRGRAGGESTKSRPDRYRASSRTAGHVSRRASLRNDPGHQGSRTRIHGLESRARNESGPRSEARRTHGTSASQHRLFGCGDRAVAGTTSHLNRPQRSEHPMNDSTITGRLSGEMVRRGWTGRQISVLMTLILVNVFNVLDRGILAILQQPIKEDLLLSDWQLGILSGPAFAALYAVSGVPIARLADRGNRSLILAIAVSVWSMMTALCGVAQSYFHLLICRLGVGAGEGACTPTTHALISSHFSARQRGLAMAVLTTSIPIAQMMAPLLGGYATAVWGWRTAFLIAGLPGILVAGLVLVVLRERPNEESGASAKTSTSYWTNVKALLGHRPYLFLCLASVFMGQALSTTNAFSASFFMRQHGFSVEQAGWVTAAGLGIAGFLGTMIGGVLADRFAGRHGRSYA